MENAKSHIDGKNDGGIRSGTNKRSIFLGILLLIITALFSVSVALLLVFLPPGEFKTVVDDVEVIKRPPGPGDARSLELLGLGAKLGPTGLAKVLYNETLNYGNVFQYGTGNTRIVVIGDLEIMKDAFTSTDSFNTRRIVVNEMLSPLQNEGSTFQTSGQPWLEIRQFTGQTILKTTYLQAYVQPRIDQSVNSLMTSLIARQGSPFNPEWLLRVFFVDVNHRIYFDRGLVYDDDDDEAFVNDVFNVQKITFEPNATMPTSPVLRAQLPLYLHHLHRFANHTKLLAAEALSTPSSPSEEPDSLVVMYERYINGLRVEGVTTLSDPDDGWRLSVDLFFSGHSSIPQIVRWMCLYLAAYQDYQQKIFEEINSFGRYTDITYENRTRLPLTVAFLTEVDRIHHHSPLGVPRFATANETVDDYHIEAGTTVISNLWQMSNDPKVWGDPRVFRPERFFLDGTGSDHFQLDANKFQLHTPFGVGLRSCPGEKIARRTLFKTMIALIQEFQIVLPEGTEPDLDQTGDFAEPYNVKFLKRI
ncbi:cytochrome P450 2J4-like [Lytechinus variegatus]|uniref:cytochrome P450 2J4-like n=1 Tax=Lytechinus variegatus TaxID=7654 RepID=UPI001BB27068|nr:cytochrome P450 2J4-like [Lytechinus variegatus]